MYNILLVDDEPMIKLGIRKLLEDSDYVLSATAGNGMEALSLLKLVPVDIVITDLKMPIMSGIELIRQLKTADFQGVILVLSNYSDFDLVRNALLEGALDYLLKTEITKRSLLECLDKLSSHLDLQMHEVQNKEKVAANAKKLLLSNWQGYLNGTSDLLAEAKQLLFPDGEKKEYELVLVNIQNGKGASERKKRLIPQMQDVLLDIFEVPEYILCLQTETYEILCIVPAITSIRDLDASVQMIQRHFSTYFNMMPLISCAQHAGNPQMIQKNYRMCHLVLRYHFYDPEQYFFPISRYGAFQDGSISLKQSFWKNISEACQRRQKALLVEVMQKFIRECCNKHIHPDWVIEAFCHYVEYRLFLSDSDSIGSEKPMALDLLRGSEDYVALLEAALSLFLPDTGQDTEKYLKAFSKKEIQDVIFYIAAHYTEPITLEDIAAYVNLNKSYLCRLFKQETGKSIFAYLNQIRMEKGAQYIRDRNHEYNIKEIAALVGIQDPFYFTRRFKEYFGVSPSEYGKTQIKSTKNK